MRHRAHPFSLKGHAASSAPGDLASLPDKPHPPGRAPPSDLVPGNWTEPQGGAGKRNAPRSGSPPQPRSGGLRRPVRGPPGPGRVSTALPTAEEPREDRLHRGSSWVAAGRLDRRAHVLLCFPPKAPPRPPSGRGAQPPSPARLRLPPSTWGPEDEAAAPPRPRRCRPGGLQALRGDGHLTSAIWGQGVGPDGHPGSGRTFAVRPPWDLQMFLVFNRRKKCLFPYIVFKTRFLLKHPQPTSGGHPPALW